MLIEVSAQSQALIICIFVVVVVLFCYLLEFVSFN